jgi:sulfur relay (sulfurtransferase) complex TusBCD TusD component (DsrE family)
MKFSDKLIEEMFLTINKPEHKSLRVFVMETAVKAGKIPANPTIEQVKSIQTEFMVMAFYHLVVNNKEYNEKFADEIYHVLRNEPCEQF